MEKISLSLLKKKEVKKELEFGEGVIKIFEPSEEQVRDIIEFQNSLIEEGKATSISDYDVFTYLIPMLTNLDFSDLEEAQIYEILSNPSMWLKMVKEEIGIVINEINRLNMLETKNKFLETINFVEQMDIVNTMPNEFVNKIEKTQEFINSNGADKIQKVMELGKQAKGVMDDETQSKIEELEKQLKELKGE